MSCDLIADLEQVRLTKVDTCGIPIPGENAFVGGCFASVSMNPEIDTTDDKIYRKPNGSVCGVRRGCPSFLGYNVEFNFSSVSPEMLSVMTNQPTVEDAEGNLVGYDSCDLECNAGFALEFWTTLINDQCADEAGNEKFLYFLLPWVANGYIGDLEIGTDAVEFTMTGSTRAGGGWETGPWDVVRDAEGNPGPLLTPLGSSCHRRMQIVTVPPPEDADCEFVTVPEPAPAPAGV